MKIKLWLGPAVIEELLSTWRTVSHLHVGSVERLEETDTFSMLALLSHWQRLFHSPSWLCCVIGGDWPIPNVGSTEPLEETDAFSMLALLNELRFLFLHRLLRWHCPFLALFPGTLKQWGTAMYFWGTSPKSWSPHRVFVHVHLLATYSSPQFSRCGDRHCELKGETFLYRFVALLNVFSLALATVGPNNSRPGSELKSKQWCQLFSWVQNNSRAPKMLPNLLCHIRCWLSEYGL